MPHRFSLGEKYLSRAECHTDALQRKSGICQENARGFGKRRKTALHVDKNATSLGHAVANARATSARMSALFTDTSLPELQRLQESARKSMSRGMRQSISMFQSDAFNLSKILEGGYEDDADIEFEPTQLPIEWILLSFT